MVNICDWRNENWGFNKKIFKDKVVTCCHRYFSNHTCKRLPSSLSFFLFLLINLFGIMQYTKKKFNTKY